MSFDHLVVVLESLKAGGKFTFRCVCSSMLGDEVDEGLLDNRVLDAQECCA